MFACYWAERAHEAPDPSAVEHLTDCSDCARGYRELAAFLDTLRDAGHAEVDALFPPARLAQQRGRIAQRLQAIGRSARVIRFPQHAHGRTMPHAGGRSFPRWVAATAAAGVFAGVAAGLFFERAGRRDPPSAPTVAVAPKLAPAGSDGSLLTVGETETDQLMVEIELAADSPRTEELAAYDELTPHIREITFTLAGH